MHDCRVLGHVLVEHDPECLVCGNVLTKDDHRVAEVLWRPGHHRGGELDDPRSVAEPGEW